MSPRVAANWWRDWPWRWPHNRRVIRRMQKYVDGLCADPEFDAYVRRSLKELVLYGHVHSRPPWETR